MVFLANTKILTFSNSFTLAQQLVLHLSTVSYLAILYLATSMPFMYNHYEFKNQLFPLIFWITAVMLTSYCLIIDFSHAKYAYLNRISMNAQMKQQEKDQNLKDLANKQKNKELLEEAMQDTNRDLSSKLVSKFKSALNKIKEQKDALRNILGMNHRRRYTGFAFSTDETKKKKA